MGLDRSETEKVTTGLSPQTLMKCSRMETLKEGKLKFIIFFKELKIVRNNILTY